MDKNCENFSLNLVCQLDAFGAIEIGLDQNYPTKFLF